MVQRNGRDGARGGPADHIRRIEAAAETHLDHAKIRRCPGEQQEPRRSQRLKDGDRLAGVHLLNLGQRVYQNRILDQRARDPEPLAQMH